MTVQTHNTLNNVIVDWMTLYRYFIALREIYQNGFPKVPGSPLDVLFPYVEGEGKYLTSHGFQET